MVNESLQESKSLFKNPNEIHRENINFSRYLLFSRVVKTAISAGTFKESLESVARELHLILGGDRVAILQKNTSDSGFIVTAVAGYPDNILGITVPKNEEKIKWVTLHQKPLRIGNLSLDNQYRSMIKNTGSVLVIPLSFRGEILGIIILESEQLNAYSESDEVLFDILGTLLIMIKVNFNLEGNLDHMIRREQLYFDLSNNLQSYSNIQQIISYSANLLGRSLNASYVKIDIQPQENESNLISYEYSFSGENEKQGVNLHTLDTLITYQDHTFGSIHLGRNIEWSQAEQKTIGNVSAQIALAIRNLKLQEENQYVTFRERTLGDISGKIWSSPNIDLLLQTAVKELGRAMNADEAVIQINKP